MSFLKKIAQSGLTQSASNIAQRKISETMASRTAQQRPAQAPPQTRQTQPVAQTRPQPARSEGVMENALAGLLGSAERFIDNAGQWVGVCPNCQVAAPANTACEQCGTHVPPSTVPRQANAETSAAAPAVRPTNCGNCGATLKGTVCEYCETRIR